MLGFGAVGEFAVADVGTSISAPDLEPEIGFVSGAKDIILVELYKYDIFDEVDTLRMCNVGPFVCEILGEDHQYEPRLITPIKLSKNLNVENIDTPVRTVSEISNIEFQLSDDDDVDDIANQHWIGRIVQVLRGTSDDVYAAFDIVFIGLITGFSYDLISLRANVSLQDMSFRLDKPLVTDLYEYTDTLLDNLIGRPKPFFRGECYSCEPVLENSALQQYRLSWGQNLETILEVRVGGVVWGESVSYPPAPGTWYSDPSTGVFFLGSETLGGEVRADARAVGWNSFTTANFIIEICDFYNVDYDAVAMAQFVADTNSNIGFYQSLEPVNILDVLDQITFGESAWWGFTGGGVLLVGITRAPDIFNLDLSLSEVEIDELRLHRKIPPILKAKVEYRRNFQPLGTAFPGVSDALAGLYKSPGIIYPVFDNSTVLDVEPKAIDLAVRRSFVLTASDAFLIRARIITSYGMDEIGRRMYEVDYWGTNVPELYDNVNVSYNGRDIGIFRVVSVEYSMPDGFVKLRLWG